MERKFYPESFEKFLKAQADQFKMTPSKKTWHGIYNDLHPGRRWPSITMSLVFIFALVIIGHLNTNEYTKILSASASTNKSSATSNLNKRINVLNSTPKQNIKHPNNLMAGTSANFIGSSAPENILTTGINYKTSNGSLSVSSIKNITSEKGTSLSSAEKITTNSTETVNNTANESSGNTELQTTEDQAEKTATQDTENKTENIIKPISKKNILNVDNANEAAVKIKKVRKNPAVISYYITPSLSYRTFSDEKMNNSVVHKPKLGYEAGMGISYKIKNELRFTTGLQINYAGYNAKASSTHPILASLMLNTNVPSQNSFYSTISSYGNGSGNENSTLKNYSLQASVPIGLQYSFGGNENFRFDAEATFQPSAILKSKAYMLSTDGKNYLLDPYIYRKWNMSTNIGTYVTIISDSYKWQIGPQIRYQMLSTYTKSYPVKEHLINYGIRLGISR